MKRLRPERLREEEVQSGRGDIDEAVQFCPSDVPPPASAVAQTERAKRWIDNARGREKRGPQTEEERDEHSGNGGMC